MTTGTAPRWMFFTDLDGTLRGHADYRGTSAPRALRMFRRRDPLLAIVTGKTRAEVFPMLRARGPHVRPGGLEPCGLKSAWRRG